MNGKYLLVHKMGLKDAPGAERVKSLAQGPDNGSLEVLGLKVSDNKGSVLSIWRCVPFGGVVRNCPRQLLLTPN